MRVIDRSPRRVSNILPPDCLMTSSRIDDGMIVPLGSPNFTALASLSSGVVEATGVFDVAFFGMGDEVNDFDSVDGVAVGDDGVAFFRGMEAYTVLAVDSFFTWSSTSFFTAAAGSGFALTARGVDPSVLIAATMDLVTRVVVGTGFSSSFAFSSSLSANKSSSSSSSELSVAAAASISSFDMFE